MNTIKFYGRSDDLFEWEHADGSGGEEIYPNSAGFALYRVKSADEGLIIWGFYDVEGAPKGLPPCWVVGVQQLDEDVPLPPWPMRLSAEGYTVTLTIDAPDDVVVEPIEDKEE